MGKHLLTLLFIISTVFIGELSYAQVTPCSLPPKWFVGHRAGLDFTGGGAPVNMAGNTWDGGSPDFSNQENTTTECLPNKNVAFYSNSCHIKDAAHVVRGPAVLSGGGNSSVQGCVTVPDPSSPTNKYFLITADVDDFGGSNCTAPAYGIYAYPVDASVSPIVVGAPIILYSGFIYSSVHLTGRMNETIAASSDLNDGYWITSIDYEPGTGAARFVSWHITSTGVNTTPVYSPDIYTAAWGFKAQGSIVINKCQNRIAYVQSGMGNDYHVWNWNPTAGQSTTVIRAGSSGNSFPYGCEFSPDGQVLYTTGLNSGDGLKQIVLSTGVVNTITTTNAGSGLPGWGNLKLGPDDKIYVSLSYTVFETGPKYLGVISTPNGTTIATAGYSGTGHTLTATASQTPSTHNGLITLGWHNPVLTINTSTATNCMDFSYTYNQYYGSAIPVLAGSEEWDWGHAPTGWHTGLGATPTHTFPSTTTYTVKLRVKDSYCQNFYTTQKTVVVACTSPVTLINFNGKLQGQGVLLSWQTASEVNNDYFELQRSVDGVTFETITKVKGAGNSTSLNSYEYTDLIATSKIVYYRLVQHDFDGATTSSSIVTVYLDKTNSSPIVVMPNPFSSSFTLTKLRSEEATILVYDILGRVLEQRSTVEGESTIELGSALASGTYLIQYVSENTSYTLRVEKQ